MRSDRWIPFVATGLAALPATGEPSCPPLLDECGDPPVCQTSSDLDLSVSIELDVSLEPIGACSPLSSFGEARSDARVTVESTGGTSGVCGDETCEEAAGGADTYVTGGDLLATPLELVTDAGAHTTSAAAGSALSSFDLSPTSLLGVFTGGTAVSSTFEIASSSGQTTWVDGLGRTAGGGTATVTNTYPGTCSGFDGSYTVELDMSMAYGCDGGLGECEDCGGDNLAVQFVSVVVSWQDDRNAGEQVFQGVNVVRELPDGTLEPVQLGLFAGGGDFVPLVDPSGGAITVNDRATFAFSIPATATEVTVTQTVDQFDRYDGDVNASGTPCQDDPGQMQMLVNAGVQLGDPLYTPRADFDLDGDIDNDDLNGFYAVFVDGGCDCIKADIAPPGGDCCVDVQDFVMVNNAIGQDCSISPCIADLDTDRDVDVEDIYVVIDNWGCGDCAEPGNCSDLN